MNTLDQVTYSYGSVEIYLQAHLTGIDPTPPAQDPNIKVQADPTSTNNLLVSIIDVARAFERSSLSVTQRYALNAKYGQHLSPTIIGKHLGLSPAEVHAVLRDGVGIVQRWLNGGR